MTPERFREVRELFEIAMNVPSEFRSRYLNSVCRDDAELFTEVEQMVAAAENTHSPLDGRALEILGVPSEPGPSVSDSHVNTESLIGPYHLLDLIGSGGMGEVWIAEQKHPVRRRVALKLIKAGMDTREIVARFESERQALALMEHPAIAKVLDAGSTSLGRPFFVMEYVSGRPINNYCDRHKLSTRERLELFMHVCEGVQHAHQKAVIHRDLKPSNILVTELDGKAVPKIIDFGVAKATSAPLAQNTVFTRAGTILGTPEYISPEQAESEGQDIDTRSDVYSLGVILYELLVGALPLDLRNCSLEEMLRKIRYEDARRPSTKLRMLGEQSAVAAQNRRTEEGTLRKLLRGDLDAITLKALEKDRARRYSAPSDLAADIQRYLRNEIVLARPGSLGYHALKYWRRHRLGVALTVGSALLLASFAILQTNDLRRITRERDRADRITDFMTKMFKVSDPSEARGSKVTAREILDKASKEVRTGLKDPEIRAQMMDTMGTVYYNLGLRSEAEPLQRQAMDIRVATLGEEHLDTVQSMNNLANTLREEGRFAQAEKLERKTLMIQRKVLGPENQATLQSMTNLSETLDYQGHYDEAETLSREALAIAQRVLGPEHRETLNAINDLAIIFFDKGRHAEAETLQRQVLEVRRRVLGLQDPDTLIAMNNLGNTLKTLERYDDAVKILTECRALQERVLGPEHPVSVAVTYNLACIAALRGQRERAFLLLQDAISHGYGRLFEVMQKDPDLASLRGDPRFELLVAKGRDLVNSSRQQ